MTIIDRALEYEGDVVVQPALYGIDSLPVTLHAGAGVPTTVCPH